jgi:hypothetical protein
MFGQIARIVLTSPVRLEILTGEHQVEGVASTEP